MQASEHDGLELWGGVECTVNRLGDQYLDQMVRNSHAEREEDLDRFAAIGFRALRFPILWERTATNDEGTQFDWTWSDRRLERTRELKMRPIAGLVHHGSGPRLTNLLDPDFGARLAGYARQVAERYPWIDDYTPVNEPLTTARFSALYGHWYPHACDPLSFTRALFNQIKGVVLAMRAIREVNPRARLVQTEDLAKVYSTPALAYQAEFENQRRWITFDLLLGRVDSSHPMWSYFRWAGVEAHEIEWFRENNCPPDVLGLNYYVVGERFLDERVANYPGRPRGSNGRHVYVDVSACRTVLPGIAGAEGLLEEVWERYRRPLAVTEAHLSCTREEQMRWLMEIWNAARTLRDRGVDVRAVTLWSLLGAFDWNSLLTRDEGHYESGVFDLRASEPRPTALAKVAESLAKHGDYDHPVLATPGWWRRGRRLLYRGSTAAQPVATKPYRARSIQQPLLITGATGTLGQAFARLCDLRGLAYRLVDRNEMDIADAASVRKALTWFRPWAVINAAGYVNVDDAEIERNRCWRENVIGPATLARACAERDDLPLVTFSSDLVFNGETTTPYHEHSAPAPLNEYGRAKLEAERRVLAVLPSALVVRTSAFFGPWDDANFITTALRALQAGENFSAAYDEIISPTYVPDLVHACLDLLIDGEGGLWHLANAGAVSWAEFAAAAAELANIDAYSLTAQPASELERRAARPRFSALTSRRAWIMRPWQEALQLYFADREAASGSMRDESAPAALVPAA
jgi:dTDP-4-dehydrorhamnose reductase